MPRLILYRPAISAAVQYWKYKLGILEGLMRTCSWIVSSCLFLMALTGCGSSFNGSLCGRQGCGSGPTPPPGTPTVASTSPTSVAAGSASFTLTVTGTNFKSGDAVQFGFTNLVSTYVSSTKMTAEVPASMVARPDSVSVVVVEPTPATLNFGTTFSITVPPLAGNNSFTLKRVNVQAKDMVWDPVSQNIYLSTPGTDSVVSLDPTTGRLGSPVALSSAPGQLAVTADGAYLYVALDSEGVIERLNLPGLTPDIRISLGATNFGNYSVMDMAPSPTDSHTLAVIPKDPQTGTEAGVLICDDAIARPDTIAGFGTGPGPIDFLMWRADGTEIYGSTTEDSPADALFVLSVDANGVQVAHNYQILTQNGDFSGRRYDAATGLVYDNFGQVADPSNGTLAGVYPLANIQGGLDLSGGMTTDGSLNIAYFALMTDWDTTYQEYVIEAYDLTRYTYLGGITISGTNGIGSKLIRWGTNGLASLNSSEVDLIGGGFVTSPARQP
jgi:hypothetical protein